MASAPVFIFRQLASRHAFPCVYISRFILLCGAFVVLVVVVFLAGLSSAAHMIGSLV